MNPTNAFAFMETTKLSKSSVVVASDDQTSAQVDGESVILDLEEGIYYGLNPVGARIWEVIQEPTSIEEVVDVITAEYDVTRDQCLDDTLSLLRDLRESNLIVTRNS